MISLRSSLAGLLPRVLAVLIVSLVPAVAFGESVTFRNEVRGLTVVVQPASMVKGVLRRDRPIMLRYGDVSPKIPLDCDKIITVYDARNTTRVLFQGSLKASAVEMYYSIVPDPGAPRVRMQRRPAAPPGMHAPGGGAMPGPGIMPGPPAPAPKP